VTRAGGGAARGAEATPRETEVLALIAQHLTNAQIADALNISQRTVESHVSAMLHKLGLPDRRSLARHAEAMSVTQVRSGRRRLPVPITALIGRSVERAALATALAEQRLVTATGPGGIGKTRLALSVAGDLAASRRDGAWFVDLVHVTDPAAVSATIAETVGVSEQQITSVDHALVALLADRAALLVLDNCEHVLDGVRICVDRIITGCPGITILATSRARLLVPYERVYVVPGMSVAANGGDAIDLFAARVAAITGDAVPPDTARVAALCQALDGIALAIELAAARFPVLGLDGLESGLEHRLRFLTAGTRGADRHASLRAAIGWSYDLLSEEDSALLRASRLSHHGLTSTPPTPSRGPAASAPRSPRGWPAWPSTACSSSKGVNRPATGCLRRSGSTASSTCTSPGTWIRSEPATNSTAAWSSTRSAEPRQPT
jgi:DNA-binding CsgD family transcriptional regulator